LEKNVAASRSAFPDSQLTAKAILADGDKAAIHATLRGTHLGELEGMPPTGKAISIDFVDIVGFQNGLAAERWMIADVMGMMTQLGLMREPGA
jgi:predicted ester cyclase